jgi:anti-sigma factor RsiW
MCSENDVALYLEGDLSPAKARNVEAHLAVCAACRDLAADLRDSQALLKSLRQDTVSSVALASVRARVVAEISTRTVRRPWWRWVYAAAGAAFVAAVGVALVLDMGNDVAQTVKPETARSAEPASLVREIPTVPFAATAVSKPKKVQVKVRQPRPEAIAEAEIPADPPKPLVVKLLTDDPNIVIYWLVDQNGGAL